MNFGTALFCKWRLEEEEFDSPLVRIVYEFNSCSEKNTIFESCEDEETLSWASLYEDTVLAVLAEGVARCAF